MVGALEAWTVATLGPTAVPAVGPLQTVTPATVWGSVLFGGGFLTLSWLWSRKRSLWWEVDQLWEANRFDYTLLIVPIVSVPPVLAILYGGGQILGWPVFLLTVGTAIWNVLSEHWNPFHLGYVTATVCLGVVAVVLALFVPSPFAVLTSGVGRFGALLSAIPGFIVWGITASRQSDPAVDGPADSRQQPVDGTVGETDDQSPQGAHFRDREQTTGSEADDQAVQNIQSEPTASGQIDDEPPATRPLPDVDVEEDDLDFPWEAPPETSFAAIGGYDEVKQQLEEEVIAPLVTDNKNYDRFDVEPVRGILFYGPPGTGKTLFARALARELHRPFVELDQASLTSKWINESPSLIGDLFDEAQRLGGVVFIDEAEVLLGGRDGGLGTHQEDQKVTNSFLTALSRDDQEFVVVLTTNKREQMDEAVLRPGRIDLEIEIGVPGAQDRFETLERQFESVPVEIATWRRKALAVEWEGAVGADIEEAVEQAKRNAAEANADALRLEHFDLDIAETVQSLPTTRRGRYANAVSNGVTG
jgi:AAA+ superfamily predicted ATPase